MSPLMRLTWCGVRARVGSMNNPGTLVAGKRNGTPCVPGSRRQRVGLLFRTASRRSGRPQSRMSASRVQVLSNAGSGSHSKVHELRRLRSQGIPRNALPTPAMAPPKPTLTRSLSYGLPALARRSHRMTTSRGWSEHPFVGWLGYHVLRCFGWEAATVQGEEALGGLREHGSCGGQSP